MLVGHLAGTAVIFLAFLGLIWVVSLALKAMHAHSPFAPEVYAFILKAELTVVYIDAIVCVVIILAGIYRFAKEVVTHD